MKKIYRSRQHRMLSGVLGGLGEYLNIDPTVVRILFIILLVVTGFFPFGLIYLALIFLMPEESRS